MACSNLECEIISNKNSDKIAQFYRQYQAKHSRKSGFLLIGFGETQPNLLFTRRIHLVIVRQ